MSVDYMKAGRGVMSSPAGLCASGAAGVMVSGRCWVLMRHRGEQVASNVVYAIAFPLASIPEDLYSFTCCPDSSVVERHLGKMEVPGSIPGRGSLINSCESTY